MPYKQYSIWTVYYISEHYNFIRWLYNLFSCFLFLFIVCICVLCTVVCMHNFHSAHIFIINSVNGIALFNNGHIVLNCTNPFLV